MKFIKRVSYFSYVVDMIKNMTKDPPKTLGRWNIDYCNNKINNKIDLSNEDHCGPCGEYAIKKAVDDKITKGGF